ncbi:MAG: BREX system P-loop protein BrxC, partial [Oscillospiraceae bacterium]
MSGFFGSGKSHFLKILSYLLKNEVVDGKHAIDFFTDGNKLTDQVLIGKIKRAGAVPTDVIIFNIDAKGDANAKSAGKDAIVDVFMKAFNEMQGFCGSLPFLADLERKLSEDNQFDAFQAKFQELTGQVWTAAREDFYFIQDDMIACLSQLGIMSEDVAKRWCEQAASTYAMSAEIFAKLVRQYCEKKGNNHHVAFLVDEIGQYIADDSGLMLSLQTVTELLGKNCSGKAWVVVTGQEDVDSILKVKGGDFSKIQGRFDTHLSLSSANVDEVIRKRILEKNQTATDTLALLFDQKEAVLKNLITFSSGAEKKLYADRADFAAVYPFIPYQFRLLGQVLTAIRTHGASGKHLAEGERSMLALFQESAVQYMDCEENILVPFNTFYNALDRFIDHTHRIVLTHAADNSKLCEFDVDLLKVLFMIKYVEQTPGTVENLTTLMVSGIDEDRIALRKQVEGSLAALIRQMLVQKNGDNYTFLTNEEQDINRAISNETVETSEIIGEVSGIVFGELIREPKYRYGNTNRYNFPYNQRVDDVYYKGNQSGEIGVRILTPYSNEGDVPENLRMLSEQSGEVLVQLPPDDTFLSEIRESLQISKFLSNAHGSLSKGFDVIKRAKQDELADKRDRIRVFVADAVKHADIYVCGDRTEIAAKDTASRISEALKKLVETRFSKLCYMETAPDTADIAGILRRDRQINLGGVTETPVNQLALEEVLRLVMQNGGRRIKTTLKFLQEKFAAAPYGFVELDVQWLVAMLFRQGKISLTLNSKNISPIDTDSDELLRYITKREYAEKLIVAVREHASDRQMKAAKDVMKDLFAIPLVGEEDDALMKTFQARARQKSAEIHDLMPEYRAESRFPGKAILE